VRWVLCNRLSSQTLYRFLARNLLGKVATKQRLHARTIPKLPPNNHNRNTPFAKISAFFTSLLMSHISFVKVTHPEEPGFKGPSRDEIRSNIRTAYFNVCAVGKKRPSDDNVKAPPLKKCTGVGQPIPVLYIVALMVILSASLFFIAPRRCVLSAF
jgi:hypothetical protein